MTTEKPVLNIYAEVAARRAELTALGDELKRMYAERDAQLALPVEERVFPFKPFSGFAFEHQVHAVKREMEALADKLGMPESAARWWRDDTELDEEELADLEDALERND